MRPPRAGFGRAQEITMQDKSNGAWLQLGSSYYAAAVGNPLDLMDDAYILLERAIGIVHLMHEAVQISPSINKQALTLSLKAVETLMEMSAGSAEQAHIRFETIGDAWVGSNNSAED
jgi:hypothetical protein